MVPCDGLESQPGCLPHDEWSQGRLRIHHKPNRKPNEQVTEDERVNEVHHTK